MNKSRYTNITLATTFVLLLPYLLLCLFIFPSGDDYSYAWKGMTTANFGQTLLDEWYTWNGRYFSNLLVMNNPIEFGSFVGYKLVPVLLIFGFIASHFHLLYKVFSLTKSQSLTFASLILITYLNAMPEIGEGLFWYTSSATYFAPLIVLPWYVTILHKKKKMSSLQISLLVILQCIMTGFNELIMLFLLIFHAVLVLMPIHKKPTNTILFLTQILFSSIVLFAPGNEIRASHFPENHNFINTLFLGGAHTLRFTLQLLLTPSFWILLVFIFKTKIKFETKTKQLHFPSSIWIWILLFLTPQIIACTAPIWSTGILGQHRTPNFAMYFQLFIAIFFFLSNKENIVSKKLLLLSGSLSNKTLLLMLVISHFFGGNGLNANLDLITGEAMQFHKESQARHETFINAKHWSDTTLIIPQIKTQPRTIFIYDISDDPKSWKNEVYTQYYGIKKRGIQIKPN